MSKILFRTQSNTDRSSKRPQSSTGLSLYFFLSTLSFEVKRSSSEMNDKEESLMVVNLKCTTVVVLCLPPSPSCRCFFFSCSFFKNVFICLILDSPIAAHSLCVHLWLFRKTTLLLERIVAYEIVISHTNGTGTLEKRKMLLKSVHNQLYGHGDDRAARRSAARKKLFTNRAQRQQCQESRER